jgi:hypothetical protein
MDTKMVTEMVATEEMDTEMVATEEMGTEMVATEGMEEITRALGEVWI